MKRTTNQRESRSGDGSDTESLNSKKYSVSDINKEEKSSSSHVSRRKRRLKVNTYIDSDISDALDILNVSPANKPPVSPGAALSVNGK